MSKINDYISQTRTLYLKLVLFRALGRISFFFSFLICCSIWFSILAYCCATKLYLGFLLNTSIIEIEVFSWRKWIIESPGWCTLPNITSLAYQGNWFVSICTKYAVPVVFNARTLRFPLTFWYYFILKKNFFTQISGVHLSLYTLSSSSVSKFVFFDSLISFFILSIDTFRIQIKFSVTFYKQKRTRLFVLLFFFF